MKMKDLPWYSQLMIDTFSFQKHGTIFGDCERELQITEDSVIEALSLVHDDYKMAVLYRYRDGLTLKEVGERTGKSATTVTSWIHHAIRKLRSKPCKDILLLGPDGAAAKQEAEEKAANDFQRERDLDHKEADLTAWVNGILHRFPTLAAVLPVNPLLDEMALFQLNLSYDIREVVRGQFQNVKELYCFLQNPEAKLRGLNKMQMEDLRKEVRRAAGQTAPEEYDTSVAAHFPDHAEMKPGTWSCTPTVIRYDPDRKPLEIGLYREPKTGEYTLQIFDGDDVIFCRTVDAALLSKNND